ncbi:MAG: acetate--CoA ligase family protein [Aeromicrobium sp.]|uniref:acetate--CoA ligase family protein n=1 Tax=Aeromicrobium sp. TaxID=1871063 RepID=UPI002635E0E8|nr:acetate--CoA ligase family protein [Aeromicrobium sp.]MDF1703559.1 acetate--CoA ligase family protein [Aeromicrobium sp.]
MTQTPAPIDDRFTRSADTTGLDALFAPRSIAILGASSDPTKIGGRPVRFVKESGFAGTVYPINPKSAEVQGLPAYPDIESVPGDVDLALVALPNSHVLDAVHACGRKGVKVVTIFSAGFAEMSEAGAAQQLEIVDTARSYGMRVLGPNCIGSMNRATGAVGTFAASVGVPFVREPLATVALASQSGAIASEWVVSGTQRGLQFDPWLSTGNEADIQLADVLAHLALDPTVEVIATYLEGARDGERLREALQIAQEAGKPVVALKVGRSEVGATAAASHTASLVGSDQVFDALFEQYGVIRVDSMAEMFDVCYALAIGRLPVGDRLGILTGSGGVGIIAADEAADNGLRVLPPSDGLQAELKEIWPPAGVGNPIDLTAQIMNDRSLFPTFVDACLNEGAYDSIVLGMTYMGLLDPWTEQLVEGLATARANHPDAPFYVTTLSRPEIRQQVEELGIPVFEDVSTAVRVLGRVTDYALRRQRFENERAARTDATAPAVAPELPVTLTEVTAKALLSAAGLGVVPEIVVTSAADAARAQVEIGEPVVLKVVSPDIPHKTEAGGVVLGVPTPDEAATAYDRIIASARAYDADAQIDGVLVAPMITDGVETILGVANDPTFGPVVVFGLGGVFVEVLKDVTYRLAPFGLETARAMIGEIRGAAMLDGVRGAEPADVEALAEALVALSRLADAHRDRLDSIDVNPFIVRPAGRGALALDALVALRGGFGEDA